MAQARYPIAKDIYASFNPEFSYNPKDLPAGYIQLTNLETGQRKVIFVHLYKAANIQHEVSMNYWNESFKFEYDFSYLLEQAERELVDRYHNREIIDVELDGFMEGNRVARRFKYEPIPVDFVSKYSELIMIDNYVAHFKVQSVDVDQQFAVVNWRVLADLVEVVTSSLAGYVALCYYKEHSAKYQANVSLISSDC